MCNYLTILLKLSQESNVWILKISIIWYSILDHHEPIESCSKCESAIDFRIKSSFSENWRMDESSPHEFNPAWSFADLASWLIAKRTREINFYSWFDKREVPWPHADIDFSLEEIREHGLNSELQVPNSNSPIHHDTFDLVEGVLVCCIDILIAKYSPNDHWTNRKFSIPEYEVLHAGCLRCEDIPISLQPERILHISSRMIVGDIHSIEVQILSRDFHRFMDIESHSTKCIFDFHSSSCHRMKTSRILWERNSDVLPFIVQLWFYFCTFYDFLLILEGKREGIAEFIGTFSDTSLLLWWEVLESFEYDRELTSLSENSILVFDQRVFFLNGWDCIDNSLFEDIERGEHDARYRI